MNFTAAGKINYLIFQKKSKTMIAAKFLWIAGSLIFIVLGSLHLFSTFFTNRFSPRDEKLENEMKLTKPILTKQTTMWNAWIGFNASHSSGAIFIGLLNFYLALRYFTVLETDNLFFLFNIVTIGFYVWLARKYWFRTPLVGITITLTCFVVAYVLTIINK